MGVIWILALWTASSKEARVCCTDNYNWYLVLRAEKWPRERMFFLAETGLETERLLPKCLAIVNEMVTGMSLLKRAKAISFFYFCFIQKRILLNLQVFYVDLWSLIWSISLFVICHEKFKFKFFWDIFTQSFSPNMTVLNCLIFKFNILII